MAMNPRTHPRGAPPDFSMAGLPANPNPGRITNALWWLVCMRLRLEPLSENGGVLAIKPGYHSYGSRLPDHGLGDPRTDHSIRRAPDRTGPWWEDFAAAHDWTFTRAHLGNYTEINLYTNRLRNAMRSLTDLRPDDVYAYTIGQIDNDKQVEGWNEYKDGDETGDATHLWHRHDSFRRNIVGSFDAMWKALTIDMGWTYTEWLQSIEEDDMPTAAEIAEAVWDHALEDGYLKDAAGKPVKKSAGAYQRYANSKHDVVVLGAKVDAVAAAVAALDVVDDADRAELARQILAGLPDTLAQQLAGELAARLAA